MHRHRLDEAHRLHKTEHNSNTVESLRGQPLGERVLARRAELLRALDRTRPSETFLRRTLHQVLSFIEGMLGCNVERPSRMAGHELSNWLERTRYLALTAASGHGAF